MPTELDAEDARDMLALQSGEELALNRLMLRHRDKLFHYLIRLLQDENEALDLAQETFVRVFHHRTRFDPKRRFSTWLFAIATNLARDRVRWLGRHPNISIDAPVANTEARLADTLPESRLQPAEQLEQNERVAEIKRALAGLPEELRTPLVLAEYENLAQAEIAQILKCTVKAVETRIYRARKQLRDSLKHLVNIS